jgi:aryl-alcohol dehydrogenase-like predicted oxidoreductase
MQYRRLGKSGLRVSVVGVGAWQFGGEWGADYTQPEVDAVVDAAREVGINLLDTAECYGDHLSERLVGNALRSDRENWIIATKFGHRYTGFLTRDPLWSAAEVKTQLEDSLKALSTDYIDLYQFHSGPNERFDNDELWEMLQRELEGGKIRHLGISISQNAEHQLHQCRHADKAGASAIQMVYNRLDREPEKEVLPLCREKELGVLARVPLASGFLSGKYGPEATFQPNDVRSKQDRKRMAERIAEARRGPGNRSHGNLGSGLVSSAPGCGLRYPGL